MKKIQLFIACLLACFIATAQMVPSAEKYNEQHDQEWKEKFADYNRQQNVGFMTTTHQHQIMSGPDEISPSISHYTTPSTSTTYTITPVNGIVVNNIYDQPIKIATYTDVTKVTWDTIPPATKKVLKLNVSCKYQIPDKNKPAREDVLIPNTRYYIKMDVELGRFVLEQY